MWLNKLCVFILTKFYYCVFTYRNFCCILYIVVFLYHISDISRGQTIDKIDKTQISSFVSSATNSEPGGLANLQQKLLSMRDNELALSPQSAIRMRHKSCHHDQLR